MTDFETITVGLRSWASGDRIASAAVELLIWHKTWLLRGDLIGAGGLEDVGDGMWRPNWVKSEEFAASSPLCSTSELAILRIAVAIGGNEYRLSGLGRAHQRAVARAFAAAVGLRLEPAIPEAAHNHPEFIPGDATCQACTRLAGKDSGDDG